MTDAEPLDHEHASAATDEPSNGVAADADAPDVEGVAPPAAGAEVAEDVALDTRTDAERERDEYLDALRRLQADFENYKKRVARQFEDLSARGVTTLVEKLLPVLDTLDLAEEHLLAEPAPGGALAAETKALVQARALLVDTLGKEGLEAVGVAGEPFDPRIHDAVAHTEGDDGPIVDEVLRSGYAWRGQVLRPAMVRVRG